MNYLIAGLGNIGEEYASTRHNMGFMVLDAWAQASGISFSGKRYGSMAVDVYRGRNIYLLKPSTYMNLSGDALRYWVNKLKIPVANVMVICDDLNLPFGTLRMRRGGSDGGHNGLKSIQERLGTQEYARIRMGIGHEFHQGGQIDYVLGGLDDEQTEQMPGLCDKVIEGCKDFCFIGVDRAMNLFNAKKQA